MDTFVTTALVGTARQQNIDTKTDTAVDGLTIPLAQNDTERELLLRAGALAVYQQAGCVSIHIPDALEPALPEIRPACSPEIAALLRGMFNDIHAELLPEALQRLHKAGKRLPYELLPTALVTNDNELQQLLLPVLGERGLWLSRCNPAWSWVTETLPATGNTLPDNAETIWQEGTARQRRSILQHLRAVHPTKAREWLEAAWKQEKAEFRTEALKTLATGLSTDDEAFLEKALNDRSSNVREVAASFLARLTSSAYARRMLDRADQMLSYEKGKLTATPPTTLDKQWERDGIIARPQSTSIGERSWWLTQVLELVPPSHWEERFDMTPTQLIAKASKTDWEQALIEAWSNATIRYGWGRERMLSGADIASGTGEGSQHSVAGWGTTWLKPLCDRWRHNAKKFPATLRYTSVNSLRISLEVCLPPQELEKHILQMLTASKERGKETLSGLLPHLPRPWGKMLGDSYLQALHIYTSTLKTNNYDFSPWDDTLMVAILALPEECFDAALEPWVAPENTNHYIRSWYEQLNAFSEAIRIRQRLIKEIV